MYAGVKEVKSYILARLNHNEKKDAHKILLREGFNQLYSNEISSISSTEVKQRLETNLDVRNMLDPKVIKLIQEKKLYRLINDSEAQDKSQRLYVLFKNLIAQIKKSSRWLHLNVPEFTQITLQKGVNTTNNVSFNRLQSIPASQELMARIVIKMNPELNKSDIFDFRKWSEMHFKNKCAVLF